MTYPPGRLSEILEPYLEAQRVTRMREVLARRTRRITAVLDRFYDPPNIAACVRSADACGLQDLHIVRAGVERSAQIGRATSMRAERWLTMGSHVDAATALAALPNHCVVVTAFDGPLTPIDDLPFDRPLAVVLGNEHDGVSAPFLAVAEHRVKLEMRGFAQSLNVSVAFALLMDKLRSRLERSSIDWALSPDEQTAILDRWIYRDVTHANAILSELERRTRLATVDPEPSS